MKPSKVWDVSTGVLTVAIGILSIWGALSNPFDELDGEAKNNATPEDTDVLAGTVEG